MRTVGRRGGAGIYGEEGTGNWEVRESEKGKKGSVVARERSLNHTLPGPPCGHKDPLFHRRLQQDSRRREGELEVREGEGERWCPSKPPLT